MMCEEQEVKTFGGLTREEKLELMGAWVDGETIERFHPYNSQGWKKLTIPHWNSETKYRIKPKPPVDDHIDWSAIKPEWKYMARDKNGDVYVYGSDPEKCDNCWVYNKLDSLARLVGDLVNVKIGNKPWDESLVKRPDGV